MKPFWQYQECKKKSCIVSTQPPDIKNVLPPHSDIAKRPFNTLYHGLFAAVFFVGFLTLFPSVFAYNEVVDREVNITPIYTRSNDGIFNHVFAVCSTDLLKGDIIFVYSDSAVKHVEIQNNSRIKDCSTFDVKILAMDPASVGTQVIKIEDKEKTIQILEKKVKSLQNIIQRLFDERDDLITKSLVVEDKSVLLEEASQKLSRIASLDKYQQTITKKLQLISSI